MARKKKVIEEEEYIEGEPTTEELVRRLLEILVEGYIAQLEEKEEQ